MLNMRRTFVDGLTIVRLQQPEGYAALLNSDPIHNIRLYLLASRAPAWRLGIALTLTGAAPCHTQLAGRGLRPQQEQLYSRASKCSKVQ